MKDITLDLSEMVNEPSQYLFALKNEHPRVYHALVELHQRRALFTNIEKQMIDFKEELLVQSESNRTFRTNVLSNTYTVPHIESYAAYEEIYNELYGKTLNPGSGWVANTMGKALANQKLKLFANYYPYYETTRKAYTV